MHGLCAAGVQGAPICATYTAPVAQKLGAAVLIAKGAKGSDNNSRMAAADTVIVILAAGKGTRLRSDLAKVLHRAGGRPLLESVIRSCRPLKAAQTLVVVGHQGDEVAALAESLDTQTVLQNPQRGTG